MFNAMWQQVVGERGELFALGFLQVNSFVLPPPPLNSCPPFVSRLVAIRLIVVVQQGSPFPAGKEKRAEIQSRIKRTKLSLVYNYLKASVGEKKEFPTTREQRDTDRRSLLLFPVLIAINLKAPKSNRVVA